MKITEEQHFGGPYYNFQGATIQKLIIYGNMNNNGDERHHQEKTQTPSLEYSDEEVAEALANIVGKGKAIDAKKKWAGAIWLLQWVCNYPFNTKQACERINLLPLPADLAYKCDYRNVRELSTLSFMQEDARYLDRVHYSKNDKGAFLEMKSVVIALGEELAKTANQKVCVNM